jgi:hypothetical protein
MARSGRDDERKEKVKGMGASLSRRRRNPRSTMIRHNDFALVLIGRAERATFVGYYVDFVLIRGEEARKILGRCPKEDEALVAMTHLGSYRPRTGFLRWVGFLRCRREEAKDIRPEEGTAKSEAPIRGRQR